MYCARLNGAVETAITTDSAITSVLFAYVANRSMVYAVSLKASTLDYVNPRAILTSGMQTIFSASCVQFSLLHASGAAFSIRVPECVLTAPDDNGLLLNVTDRGLGDSWHMFWLPLDIPAGYNNTCQALLQFEVVYDLSLGTRINTAVNEVLLHNGTCLGEFVLSSFTMFGCISFLYIGRSSAGSGIIVQLLDIVPPARSVACDFTDISQCGYRDASGSSVRWKRKPITNAGKHVLDRHFVRYDCFCSYYILEVTFFVCSVICLNMYESKKLNVR